MKKCATCDSELTGRQRLFCSRKCKNTSTNNLLQNYTAQQERGSSRRRMLIESKGGKCEKCGYDRNQSALSFHHLDPNTKLFGIDIRQCSNRTLKVLIEEVEKCQLLCLNCHAETHHPVFFT